MGISADRLRRAQLAVLLNRRGAQTGWCPTITLISTASALAWIVRSKAFVEQGQQITAAGHLSVFGRLVRCACLLSSNFSVRLPLGEVWREAPATSHTVNGSTSANKLLNF
ncbi:MAG: hypothetical protein O2936_02875 [Proteobacteria bacterium]|jgi:hypothetical protein|nr:hypothetical protein [Pseudomonadota bacterium]